MQHVDRKALVREYKRTPQPAGIYQVRNTAAGKSLVGSSLNVPGMLNRVRFQLANGSHPDAELQSDWNRLGADAFAFTDLDRLEPRDEPSSDPAADLGVLKALWLEKLAAAGELLYAAPR